jgi:hypothetical protein
MHYLHHYTILVDSQLHIDNAYIVINWREYYIQHKIRSSVILDEYNPNLYYSILRYTCNIFTDVLILCDSPDKRSLLFDEFGKWADTCWNGINLNVSYRIIDRYGKLHEGVRTLIKIHV